MNIIAGIIAYLISLYITILIGYKILKFIIDDEIHKGKIKDYDKIITEIEKKQDEILKLLEKDKN